MLTALMGKKLGMTRVFTEDGRWVPVTIIEAGPCTVVQRKTESNDGYDAVQLGYGAIKDKHLTQPMQGHFAKAGAGAKRHLQEFRVAASAEAQPGDEVTVEIFKAGDRVDITGKTKGKGFQGVIKRHGYGGGPGGHGSHFHRAPGSIGQSTFPARVLKGKGLPGHMGSVNVTTQGLEVVEVQAEKNLLLVRGSVPGANGGLVTVRQTHKHMEA